MNIQEKLATIQTKFHSKKSRYNSFGKYNFRSAEDILEAIKPYLLELGVTVTVTEELISFDNTPYATKQLSDGAQVPVLTAVPVIQTTATIMDHKTKENAFATAVVGVDLAQKGMQVPQAFGSASSYGKKYALGNLLLIDDTADSDATNDHGRGKKAPAAKPKLTGEALKKAKAAIKAGQFTVEDVQKKYDITPAVLKTLK